MADVTFSEDGYSLQTKGFIVDSIQLQGACFHLEHGPPTNITPLIKDFTNWWSLFLKTFDDSPSSRNLFLRAPRDVRAGSCWKIARMFCFLNKRFVPLTGHPYLGSEPL